MLKKLEVINPQNYKTYIQKAFKAPFISKDEKYKTIVAEKIEFPQLDKLKSKMNIDDIIQYKQDLLFKKEYKPQKTTPSV